MPVGKGERGAEMLKEITCDEKGLNKLETRDHVCLVYGTEKEWKETVPVFIEAGINRGEKCVYICNTHHPDFVRNSISERGMDVDLLESSGRLVIYVFQDFLKNLELDVYDMINFLYRLTQKAIAEGYIGMRLTLEMKDHPHIVNSEQILKFESRLSRYLFNRVPCMAMCLYDKRVNDPHLIKDAIMAHPLLLRGDQVIPNSHSLPSAKVVNTQKLSDDIDSLLEAIQRQGLTNERLRFFNDLLNESLQAFCAMYSDNSIMLCNESFCSMTGYHRDELYEHVRFTDFILLESMEKHIEALRKIKVTGEAQRYEVEINRRDGSSLPVEVLLHQLRGRSNNGRYYYAFLDDISERKAAERILKESALRFSDIVDFLPDPTLVVDPQGKIIVWNQAMEQMTGVEAGRMLGETTQSFAYSIYGERKPMLADQVLMRGKKTNCRAFNGDSRAMIAESFTSGIRNKELYLWAKAAPVYNQQGEVAGAIEIIRDITDLKLTEQRLLYLNQRDRLTGLYNRDFFEEALQRLEAGTDYSGTVGIIVCDLDGLKDVNDTLGHQKGDELLAITARLISEPFREEDLVARIGGDEFAVLLPYSPVHGVERACQRIRQAVDGYNQLNPGLPLSLSMGYAVARLGEIDLRALFIEADDNMCREKLLQSKSPRSSVVNVLMHALKARDFTTERHADRLQSIAINLGQSLGWSSSNLSKLRLLAQFHDIGKIGIPDRVLFKPGSLNSDEMLEMRKHCEIGYHIAKSAPALSHIAEGVLKHHERWDGNGYPLRLSDNEIPLECRVLSIADAYDAMISDRPYRKAMERSDAIEEMRRCSGSQFDPHLVERFLNIIDQIEQTCLHN